MSEGGEGGRWRGTCRGKGGREGREGRRERGREGGREGGRDVTMREKEEGREGGREGGKVNQRVIHVQTSIFPSAVNQLVQCI